MNSFMHQSESAYWAGREGPHATGWDDSSAPLGNSATRLSLHTQRGTASARLNLARSASEPRTQRERAGIFTRWATRWIYRSRRCSGPLLTPHSALPSVPTFDEAVGTIANSRQSKMGDDNGSPGKNSFSWAGHYTPVGLCLPHLTRPLRPATCSDPWMRLPLRATVTASAPQEARMIVVARRGSGLSIFAVKPRPAPCAPRPPARRNPRPRALAALPAKPELVCIPNKRVCRRAGAEGGTYLLQCAHVHTVHPDHLVADLQR
jgi:hypothetical protein